MGITKRTGARFILVTLAVLFLACFAALAGYRLITGKSLGLKSLIYNTPQYIADATRMVMNSRAVTEDSRGSYTNVVFLHHSTGKNLIRQGNVRALFSEQGYDFYDHGYKQDGLTSPEGEALGYHYAVPRDNTDPDGLVTIFRQREYPLPVNTLSALLQHEVIVYKSCYEPGNNITSDEQLQQYKDWYIEMRGVMQAHPEKVFVIATIPPLNPSMTNPDEAARARTFANWLKSDEYLAGSENIFVFDFFDQLAESDPAADDYNMLRADYRKENDSHPTKLANQEIGPRFAAFIMEKAAQYRAAVAQK